MALGLFLGMVSHLFAITPAEPPMARLMSDFLLQREALFSASMVHEAVAKRMMALLEKAAAIPVTDTAVDLQLRFFRYKGYSLLAQARWSGAAAALQQARQILDSMRPVRRNMTYDDMGRVKVIYRGDPASRDVALTFDDGPVGATAPILDVLKEYGAKATFFCVGQMAREMPHLVRRIRQEGHLLGNHTWSHARGVGLARLGPDAVREEVHRGAQAILDASGLDHLDYFRLPYGSGVHSKEVNGIISECHTINAYWTIDTRDWAGGGANRTISAVLDSSLLGGAVILCHDHANGAVTATREIVSTLQARGYRFVTMAEMFSPEHEPGFRGGFVEAAGMDAAGQHREAFRKLVALADTAPTAELGREALDYAYQIAAVSLRSAEADEARTRLAAQVAYLSHRR